MYIAEKNLYLFIATGQQNKMFTLRVMTEGYTVIGREKSPSRLSYHVKTLGTKKSESMIKAVQYSEIHQIPLNTEQSFKIDPTEIQRKTREQIAIEKEQKAAADELKEAHALALKMNRSFDLSRLNFDENSIVIFGKYKNMGKTIKDLIEDKKEGIPYLQALKAKMNDSDSLELILSTAQAQLNWVAANIFPTLPKLREKKPSQFIGNVGEKRAFKAKVINQFYSVFETPYGVTARQFTWILEDENDNVLVVKYSGDKFRLEISNWYEFTAKIKSHDVYRPKDDPDHEINQTRLFYLSKVTEVQEAE